MLDTITAGFTDIDLANINPAWPSSTLANHIDVNFLGRPVFPYKAERLEECPLLFGSFPGILI
jgi:hypothetical protein